MANWLNMLPYVLPFDVPIHRDLAINVSWFSGDYADLRWRIKSIAGWEGFGLGGDFYSAGCLLLLCL